METILGIAVGIGLSAACGFRIFVPLLIMNLAALSGQIQLPAGFAWIGNTSATVAFASATIIEVICYYVPGTDQIMDIIATPAAVVAGTIMTASLTELSPFFKWTLALIAGGGVAGLVQGSTVSLRAKSSITTMGTGNFLVATLELIGAVIVALLAILLPVFCLILIILFFVFVFRKIGRLAFREKQTKTG
ncbi:MAG: DUF4126 domain-containing protein [Syntrophaceae bacterium]|nr:DUF4126 domain-containing protein [Syntrophaceae bacterium]